MIELVEWPLQTNSEIRDEILKNKINEIIASSVECRHEDAYLMNPRTGMMRCKSCKKVWKRD